MGHSVYAVNVIDNVINNQELAKKIENRGISRQSEIKMILEEAAKVILEEVGENNRVQLSTGEGVMVSIEPSVEGRLSDKDVAANPDKAEVMRLASELVAPKEIARRQGVAVCKVWALLKSKGIDLWKLNEVPVEITDRQGNIVLTFPSLTAACEHYGKAPCSLKVLNHRLERLNTGHTARYNEEKYIIRYGRKYGDKK